MDRGNRCNKSGCGRGIVADKCVKTCKIKMIELDALVFNDLWRPNRQTAAETGIETSAEDK